MILGTGGIQGEVLANLSSQGCAWKMFRHLLQSCSSRDSCSAVIWNVLGEDTYLSLVYSCCVLSSCRNVVCLNLHEWLHLCELHSEHLWCPCLCLNCSEWTHGFWALSTLLIITSALQRISEYLTRITLPLGGRGLLDKPHREKGVHWWGVNLWESLWHHYLHGFPITRCVHKSEIKGADKQIANSERHLPIGWFLKNRSEVSSLF